MTVRLSDLIEARIKELIKQETEGVLAIQRSELAEYFGCVPSQINYVLSTRFSPDKGYIVEGRRGGGGCIYIKEISAGSIKSQGLRTAADTLKVPLSQHGALLCIAALEEKNFLTAGEAAACSGAVNDRTLEKVEPVGRDTLRTDILKSMLLSISLKETENE